jgi:hypothetical protein
MAEVGNTYQLEPEKDEMYPSIKLVFSPAEYAILSKQLYKKNSKMSLMTHPIVQNSLKKSHVSSDQEQEVQN